MPNMNTGTIGGKSYATQLQSSQKHFWVGKNFLEISRIFCWFKKIPPIRQKIWKFFQTHSYWLTNYHFPDYHWVRLTEIKLPNKLPSYINIKKEKMFSEMNEYYLFWISTNKTWKKKKKNWSEFCKKLIDTVISDSRMAKCDKCDVWCQFWWQLKFFYLFLPLARSATYFQLWRKYPTASPS